MIKTPLQSNISTVVEDKGILSAIPNKQTFEQIEVIHEVVLPGTSKLNDSVMKKTMRSNATP